MASVAMGLCKDGDTTPGSIPKIVMVSSPSSHLLISGVKIEAGTMDLVVRALSVGQPHRAVPITVAMAIAAAANIEGSTVHATVSSQRVDSNGVTLGHPSGTIMVGSEYDQRGSLICVNVLRTARRLMDGYVYWK